jgi:peptide/nickel transport system permease protein
MTLKLRLLGKAGRLASTLVLVAIATFLLVRMLPGDPATVIAGPYATADTISRIRADLKLDEPVTVQLAHYAWGLLRGDLGTSFRLLQPITSLIAERAPVTILLVGLSSVLALSFAVPLAMLSVRCLEHWPDRLLRAAAQLVYATPIFLTGLVLISMFAVKIPILPPGGVGRTSTDLAVSLVLPALSLALVLAPLLFTVLRAALIELMSSDLAIFAFANGFSRRHVMWRHLLPNASVTMVNFLGVQMAGMFGGTILIETVFALPGVGRLMLEAVLTRDYPVIQGTTIFIAVLVVVILLATEIVQALIDPRLRA